VQNIQGSLNSTLGGESAKQNSTIHVASIKKPTKYGTNNSRTTDDLVVNEDNFASINVASTVDPSPAYPKLNEVWKKKGRSHERRSLSQLSHQ
jgi:hypothetical protein